MGGKKPSKAKTGKKGKPAKKPEKKKTPEYLELKKYKEVTMRMIGIMLQRRLLPKVDADYILEPLEEKSRAGYPGMMFYHEDGTPTE